MSRRRVANDDSTLLSDVIAGDQRAWRTLVRSCEPQLRDRVRSCLEVFGEYAATDVDDIMGAFWLRIVDEDMRWLRAFNPSHGASLTDWLALHVTQVAHEQGRKNRRNQKREVPLEQARHVAIAPAMPNASNGAINRAIRDAVRDVVREELRTVLREEMMRLQPATSNEVGQTDEYLSVADAAKTAHVHEATIRSWINTGQLAGYRAGRHRRIKRVDLAQFMSSVKSSAGGDLDERAAKLAAI